MVEVTCPLVGKKIELIICEDTSTAAEGMQPIRFVPQEMREVDKWKEKCLKCPQHPE